jgi:uncharacterized protein involved in exopolysaccharide biosynthesis
MQVIRAMRQYIKLIAVCALVGAVVGVLFGIALPESYRAQATLQYVALDTQSESILGRLAGGAGLLAGLAGGVGEDKAAAVTTLQSRTVVNDFIQKNGLAPRLFNERWDATANKWKSPEKQPTPQELYRRFSKNLLRVASDQVTGLVYVSIKWSNAKEAAEWTNGLIAAANAYLKGIAIAEGERNVAYLSQQVFGTMPVEVRQAAGTLLTAELRKVMVARGRSEFAFRTVESASPPDLNWYEGPVLMGAAGAALGILLGVTVSFVRRYLREPSGE